MGQTRAPPSLHLRYARGIQPAGRDRRDVKIGVVLTRSLEAVPFRPEPVRGKIRGRKGAMSFGSLVFTPLVKKLQERYGSRRQYERMENSGGSAGSLHSLFESEFLAQRDSFYLATTGWTGWPYVQHRGGPKGFLKSDRRSHPWRLGIFAGNKQYISTGNTAYR